MPTGLQTLTLVASSGTSTGRTERAPCAKLKARSLAAGGYFSATVKPSGELWAWGQNHKGQLGRNTPNVDDPTPAAVSALSGVVSVALGEKHALVLMDNGEVLPGGATWRASWVRTPTTL